jgi:Ca2+-binding RTX toxin-like protein
MRASTRRPLFVLLAAVGLLAIAPSFASAAAKITSSGGAVRVAESSGGPLGLTVTIASDASSITLVNTGGWAEPIPPGCTRIDPATIRCNAAGVGSLTVKGGDADDSITTVDHPFFHITVISVQTEGGNDVVNLGQGLGAMGTCDMGDGDDICTSGDGATTCNMGAGNDSCTTGAGADSCDMGAGNDVCSTGGGTDQCLAGKGGDRCTLGPANDVCRMGGGNDRCVGGGGRHDVCTGNGGADVARSCEVTRSFERD